MKVFAILTLLVFITLSSEGQAQLDSLSQNLDAVTANIRLDSTQQSIQHLPDSLLPTFHRLDSVRNNFILAADSLQNKYKNSLSQIDGLANKFNTSLDSLTSLNLPVEHQARKLDSLQQLRKYATEKFSSKLDSLKSKATEKIISLDLPPEYNGPAEKLTRSLNELNIDTHVAKIPGLKISVYSLPDLKGIPDLTSKVGNIPRNAIEAGQIPATGDIAKLSSIEIPKGDLGNIPGQAQAYQEDIKNITSGNLDDVQKVPEAIESQTSKIDGVDELQKKSGVIDQHKAKLDELKDTEGAKGKIVNEAKRVAYDHFAGKQEQLRAAMDKISKYKQKYSSVSSIKDLPKRPPNPMKGKPFVERLIPGLYLQYQQKNAYLLDVNPYLGYKITGRFNVGLGWNHRTAWNSKYKTWDERSRIFGPRAYVDFKLGKGFIAHLEGETMNSFVPSTLLGHPDSGQREWVWSCMTGIKKEYKIYKNLKGTALIQYNLFNRYYRAPYVDRLNSRIGFEYTLRRAKPKSQAK